MTTDKDFYSPSPNNREFIIRETARGTLRSSKHSAERRRVRCYSASGNKISQRYSALKAQSYNKDFYIIAHNIRSLYNVGTIFRTADALGVSRLFLSGYSGCPPSPQISKVALGSEQSVSWEHVKNVGRLLKDLRQRQVTIVALEKAPTALNYLKYKPCFPLALIIGNEVRGVSKQLLARVQVVVALPMHGAKESLNVGVALGAIGYYLDSYRHLVGK